MSAEEMSAEEIARADVSDRDDKNRNGGESKLRGGQVLDTRRYKRKFAQRSLRGNVKKNKLDIGSRLKESDIGITEYIGKHAGFSAIIKERYSDFHVNEIDLDGQVAKLTHQDIPCEPEDDEDIEDLNKLIPSAIWEQLQSLNEKNPSSSSFPNIEIDVTNLDKAKRKIIHMIAKKLANVISQTIERSNKKFIVIARNTKEDKSGKGMRRDNRVDWKKRGGDYCHFLLHKVNMDTMDALNRLAVSLRVRPDSFSYAGTKDRRAWTTQWVSLKKVDPRNILKASKTIHGAYVGNFKYAKNSLKLGMLRGNRFRIALRSAGGTDEDIERAMASLRDNGFINYYGLQRFGTVASIPTHEIGKRLLQGKWYEAIELILKPRPGEQDMELAEARRIYAETKDTHAAYAKIKRIDKIEARLLKGLQVSSNQNPLGALDFIPRNIRLMYIHAYQSFVWNHMVSRRIREFGTNVIVGDLVYDKHDGRQDIVDETIDYSMGATSVKNKNNTISTKEENINSTVNEEIEDEPNRTESIKLIHDLTEEQESTHNFPAVKILKEEDLPSYTLTDIIMPQPGWRVTYPSYAKAWFDEFLAKDELTTDLRQKNKKYSLSGAYRKILEIPMNLSWKIMRYKEKHDNLIAPDIDEIKNIAPLQDKPDGKNKALIVEISLEPSNYATMALREILKSDTSAEIQAALSASHDTKVTQSNITVIETEDESGLIQKMSTDLTEFQKDHNQASCDIKSYKQPANLKQDQIIEIDEAKNARL